MHIIIFLIIIIFLFFYLFQILLNRSKHTENFCYGNDYCNGKTDNTLCINQKCLKCGLSAECKSDYDCSPNNCINGCCV